MAEAAKRPKRARARKWQGRIAVVLFTLFPLGVLAGLLSPGVISLQLAQVAEAVAPEAAPPLDFQGVDFGRSPLLVPRDFSAGFIPELLDLDQLFRDTAVRPGSVGRAPRSPAGVPEEPRRRDRARRRRRLSARPALRRRAGRRHDRVDSGRRRRRLRSGCRSAARIRSATGCASTTSREAPRATSCPARWCRSRPRACCSRSVSPALGIRRRR